MSVTLRLALASVAGLVLGAIVAGAMLLSGYGMAELVPEAVAAVLGGGATWLMLRGTAA